MVVQEYSDTAAGLPQGGVFAKEIFCNPGDAQTKTCLKPYSYYWLTASGKVGVDLRVKPRMFEYFIPDEVCHHGGIDGPHRGG